MKSTFLSIAAALLILTYPLPSNPPPDRSSSPPAPVIAHIQFETPAQLRALAAELDVWEVHHDAGYIVALVHPTQHQQLTESGYRVQIDRRLPAYPSTIPDYPCYRTIDELYADLEQVAADHPDITQLIDIGDSYEGRDIWVIRITNRAVAATKPVLFLMANIHGRELITNEAAMVFIDYLTDNYGGDADATWLVDHHEIHVLVSANPDGHVKNEAGWPWAYWRKNANPENGCAYSTYGVDLNRNHSFRWGCCGGSSGSSCAETYRGPSAGSEVETQVVQDYVRDLFPDQRGPEDSDAAPADATGVLITLHSYGDLVLWPWGWTSTPSPNHSGLQALGRKLATYNGYDPDQAYGLYPTDGTTDDWSYGELGIASYTFEIGSGSDGFYPSCSRYDELIQPNIPAFLYAAKVARTPYRTAQGPDALTLSATPDAVAGEWLIHLTAAIDDGDNGGDAIAEAEWYLDEPPWAGGTAAPLEAVDGAYDEAVEAVEADIRTDGWTPGKHTLFVRGRDAQGNWGPISAVFLEVQDNPVDLQIGKDVSASAVRPGERLTYTLTLTNNSPISLTGLTVTDALPSALSFVSAAPTATFEGGQARWSGMTISSQACITFSLATQVGDDVAGGALIRNADYGARADQIPDSVMGNLPADSWVAEERWVVYLLLVFRNARLDWGPF